MNMQDIKELNNIHLGCDIWVPASGPSMNYILLLFSQMKLPLL